MPYIESKSDRRQKLQKGEPALTAGELNYQIFYYVKHNLSQGFPIPEQKKVKHFVEQFLAKKGNPNYQLYNDMTGALVRCAKEIKRRLHITVENTFKEIIDSYDDEIAKYEDKKIIENGDVE
jgi:hypothetical protein